jgi:hypothetical protein
MVRRRMMPSITGKRSFSLSTDASSVPRRKTSPHKKSSTPAGVA